MNPRDAICESDLYVGVTDPTYYCEHCHGPMGSPSVSGLCWTCELEREQPDEDEA